MTFYQFNPMQSNRTEIIWLVGSVLWFRGTLDDISSSLKYFCYFLFKGRSPIIQSRNLKVWLSWNYKICKPCEFYQPHNRQLHYLFYISVTLSFVLHEQIYLFCCKILVVCADWCKVIPCTIIGRGFLPKMFPNFTTLLYTG